jgi:hypothetical protein
MKSLVDKLNKEHEIKIKALKKELINALDLIVQ